MRISFLQIFFLLSIFWIIFYNNSSLFVSITNFFNSFLQNIKKNSTRK